MNKNLIYYLKKSFYPVFNIFPTESTIDNNLGALFGGSDT